MDQSWYIILITIHFTIASMVFYYNFSILEEYKNDVKSEEPIPQWVFTLMRIKEFIYSLLWEFRLVLYLIRQILTIPFYIVCLILKIKEEKRNA